MNHGQDFFVHVVGFFFESYKCCHKIFKESLDLEI